MALGQSFDLVLAGARADSPWAYERLYRDLAPSVCGYLRLQGAREPDDLTSEVFLGVFRGLAGFSGGEARFRSWVFTIAHRRLIDERRRTGVRPELADRPAAEDDEAGALVGGDVEDDALRRLSIERVRGLCAGLSADQRDVILLRTVSDLTVGAVAEALGRTPAAVKALQHRALANLRKAMVQEGVPL